MKSRRMSLHVTGKDGFVRDILYWIILTDQWPFRMSYILVIIENADHRKSAGRINEAIEDDVSLFDIFKK